MCVEIARFLDNNGVLQSVRADGVTILSNVYASQTRTVRKKESVSLEVWTAAKLAQANRAEPWRRQITKLPKMRDLQKWIADGVCETPTGHRCEPDGHGPDGVPSWLLALGVI